MALPSCVCSWAAQCTRGFQAQISTATASTTLNSKFFKRKKRITTRETYIHFMSTASHLPFSDLTYVQSYEYIIYTGLRPRISSWLISIRITMEASAVAGNMELSTAHSQQQIWCTINLESKRNIFIPSPCICRQSLKVEERRSP